MTFLYHHYNKLLTSIILFFVIYLILNESQIGLYNSIFLLISTATAVFILLGIKYKEYKLPMPASIFLFLFLIWAYISTFTSTNLSKSLWEIIKLTSLSLLFIAEYNLLRKKQKLQNFMIISFIIAGTIIFLKDFITFLTESELTNVGYFVGSFAWHNQMAGFLLVLIPLTLGLMLNTRKTLIKYILSFILIIMLTAMLLTYSRGGWISLGLGLIIFIILRFSCHSEPIRLCSGQAGVEESHATKLVNSKRSLYSAIAFALVKQASSWLKAIPLVGMTRLYVKNFKYLALISVISTLIFIFILTRPYNQVAKNVKNIALEITPQSRTVSGNLRISVWQNGLKMISSHPVLGLGPGTFGSAYYKFQSDPWLYAKNAHNYFLEIAAETGLPGLASFSILIVYVVVFLIMSLRGSRLNRETKQSFLNNGVFAAFAASVTHSLIDVDWSRISLFSIFWLLMAIIYAQTNKKDLSIKLTGIKKFIYLIPILFFASGAGLLRAENYYKLATDPQNKNNDIYQKIDYLEKAVAFNPFDSRYLLELGVLEGNLNNNREAANFFQKALKVYTFSSEAYYQIGVLEFKKKNYKKAESHFKNAIDMGYYSGTHYYLALADAYLQEGKMDLAEKTLKTSIEKAFPLNESYYGFKYMYDYTGFNKQLAVNYLKLANLQIRQGKRDEAKKYIIVVKNILDPENPSLRLFEKIINE